MTSRGPVDANPSTLRLPPPGGPNWGLVLTSLVLLAAAGAIVGQLLGLTLPDLSTGGPTTLVVAGLALVLVGQVGLLRRRRRNRR